MLFQKIVNMTAGNFVPAIYASMRKHEAGEVHRYYETLAEKLIQGLEKKAISRIGTELAAVGYVHSLDLTLEPSRSTAYIGSPMCPHIQSVRDYLADEGHNRCVHGEAEAAGCARRSGQKRSDRTT